ILKEYIEEKKLAKTQIAKKVGITYNYLSTIFHKDTLDASLLEKLCVATGLHPMTFYEYGENGETVSYSDIKAKANVGNAEVKINHNSADFDRALADKERIIEEKNRLIEEKERTIQILLAASSIKLGTGTGQD
ncbi:MAG: helix-turn-helix domain-containing protein, partial [Muribaculaceae bacterium]|nr:helix-turn-helix domain-containing protein [Muribaculaceae bacterium]